MHELSRDALRQAWLSQAGLNGVEVEMSMRATAWVEGCRADRTGVGTLQILSNGKFGAAHSTEHSRSIPIAARPDFDAVSC